MVTAGRGPVSHWLCWVEGSTLLTFGRGQGLRGRLAKWVFGLSWKTSGLEIVTPKNLGTQVNPKPANGWFLIGGFSHVTFVSCFLGFNFLLPKKKKRPFKENMPKIRRWYVCAFGSFQWNVNSASETGLWWFGVWKLRATPQKYDHVILTKCNLSFLGNFLFLIFLASIAGRMFFSVIFSETKITFSFLFHCLKQNQKKTNKQTWLIRFP